MWIDNKKKINYSVYSRFLLKIFTETFFEQQNILKTLNLCFVFKRA